MVCSKCNQDKTAEDFYLYNGKPRSQCKLCLKNAAINRLRSKIDFKTPNLNDITINEPTAGRKRKPENTPLKSITEDFSQNPDYKYCFACDTWKPKTEYFVAINKKRNTRTLFRRCKWCHNKLSREKARIYFDNKKVNCGGSEKIISKPNKYADEYQREQVFWLMELLGWTYNDNGVWSKEGIKDKDNKWVNIKKKELPPKPVKIKLPEGIRKDIDIEKLLFLKKCNWSIEKMAEELKCSTPTIRSRLKRYG